LPGSCDIVTGMVFVASRPSRPTRRRAQLYSAIFCCFAAPALAIPGSPRHPRRRVHFYTFSDTIPHPGLCALAEATSELGGVLRVIGLSKRPGYILIHSHSPTLKFLMLQEVVEYEVSVGRVREDDLMIFADGHDTLLQRPIAHILAAYERFAGSPFLISGEKNCWPWPHTHESHGKWDPGMAIDPNTTFQVHKWLQLSAIEFCRAIPERGPYRYPNIGLSMGPVFRVLEVLRRNNRIVLDEDVNDQGAMWLVIIRHAEELNIEIDQNAEVFLNMLQYQPGDLEREPCADDYFRPGLPVPPVEHPGFVVTGRQEYCPAGAEITHAEVCMSAAAALGLQWAGAFRGVGDHWHCLHADDGRNAVFFNSAGAVGAWDPPNMAYRSVCLSAPRPHVRENSPPRNLLTNTTPALLHFNGPSHEDETWPSCYHAWTREFRVVGAGHVMFDVDHDTLLDTDFLCEYGWYTIRDFHALPVHNQMLEYLKAFYQQPVDPGLSAWRGNMSAVDSTRLGREEDLHSESRFVHIAISRGRQEA